MKKNIIIIVSIMALISASISNVIFDTKAVDGKAIESQSAKISAPLKSEMTKLANEEEIYVYVWSKDVNEDTVLKKLKQTYPEEYAVYVKNNESTFSEADITYANSLLNSEEISTNMQITGANAEVSSDIETAKTDQLITASIEHKRELFAETYTANNDAIASRYPDAEIVFQSKYAPMQIMKVNKNTINEMIKDDSIEQINLYENMELKNSLANANIVSRASDVKRLNDGEGVKIGMIEPALPDNSDDELYEKQIYMMTPAQSTASDDIKHATITAKILVGKTNGLAPGATLYSATCHITELWTYYQGVEWLLDRGVNIINMSCDYYVQDGYEGMLEYENMDKWTDHIAVMHNVHFVVCAGNNAMIPTVNKIGRPATAYNVITVGAYDDKNTSTHSDDTRAVFSAYLEHPGYPEKPNLVASGVDIRVGTSALSGTSVAAAQVSGVIAQLCSYKPAYKQKPAAMGAILMAGATRKVYGSNGGNSGGAFTSYVLSDSKWISEYEGAGKLNAYISRAIMSNSMVFEDKITTSTYNKAVSMGNNAKYIRVVIFWNKQNTVGRHRDTLEINDTTLPNLDLCIHTTSGIPLGESQMRNANYEIIDVYAGVNSHVIVSVVPQNNVSANNLNFAMAIYKYK